MKSLEETLAYQNKTIVYRFMNMLDIDEKTAMEIFEETKKWLWLCAKAGEDRNNGKKEIPESLVIDNSLLIIDEMWHNFICFTREYADFCENYLGKFIHHSPNPEIPGVEKNINPDEEKNKRRLQYSYVFDELGEDTLKKWYDDFSNLYTPEKILSFRKE